MQTLYSYLIVRVSDNADKGFKMYDPSDSIYIDVAVHCKALGEGYDNNLIAITVFFSTDVHRFNCYTIPRPGSEKT